MFKSGPSFLFFVILAVLINGLSPVFTTFIISKIIAVLESSEVIYLNSQSYYLLVLIVLMLFSVILSLFTNNIKTIISELTSQRLSHNIQTTVADKFQKVPQSIIDTPSFQDLYKNTTEKVLTEPMSVAETLFGLISCGISMIGYISIISTLNIFAMLLMISLFIPIYFLKGKSRNLEFGFIKNILQKFVKFITITI